MQKTTAFGAMFRRKQWARVLQKLNVPFIMKVSIVVIMCMLLSAQLLMARDGFGQSMNEKQITLELRDVSLRNALNRIERLSGLRLAYILEQVAKYKSINLEKETRSVAATLELILAATRLDFKQDNNIILIYPKEKKLSASGEVPTEIYADKIIQGKVINEKGEPVSGVSVYVKGNASNGTVTNESGFYNLEVPDNAATLVFSFIGMETLEMAIGGKTELNATLKLRAIQQEEVIVVGYGTKKKANLTGAVSSIKMDDVLGSRPVTSTSKALEGAIPGLRITYGTGQPGTGASLNIRGLTSLNGGSPLVLMDNVPVSIEDINPADIESVSVLKDASSASIYGARAAFGVILITTKKGARNQRPKFDYSTNISVTRASTLPEKPTPLEYVNALKDFGTVTYWAGQDIQKWQELLVDYQNNPGAYPKGIAMFNNLPYPLAPVSLHNDLFPGGAEQMHNFSFTGGSDKTNYRVSMGYADEDGIMVSNRDKYKRYNFNAYLNTAITSKLTASINALYKNDKMTSPTNQGQLYYNAVTEGPMLAKGYDTASTGEYLPYATSENIVRIEDPLNNSSDVLRLFGKMDFTPLQGLKITGEYTFSKSNFNQSLYTGIYRYINPIKFDAGPLNGTSSYYKSNSQINYSAFNLYGSYERKLNDHTFSLLAGMNNEISKQSDFNVSRLNVITGQAPSISTSTGIINGDDNYNEFEVLGFYGRFNYSYKNRYLLEANGRYDGSSRFPDGHRFGFFPSFSAGWNLTEEKFMQPLTRLFNLIKLRGSWGEVGNQVVLKTNVNGNLVQDYYPYIPGMSPVNASWINPSAGVRFTTLTTPLLVSSSFTWEKVRTANAGIDIAMLSNRLNVNFDLFKRKTIGMLIKAATLPAALGTDAPKKNAGDLESKGWELEISWKDKINDFRYSVGFNLSDNQGYITKYDNPGGLLSDYYVGQRIGDIWGYITQGYYSVDDFVRGSLNANLQNGQLLPGVAPYKGVAQNPGDIRYLDLNGDSVIFSGNNTLSDPGDRKIIGNSNRRLLFGLIGNASYKNFDLSFFMQGVGKLDIWLDNQVYFPYQGQFGGIFKHQLDYWTPTNTNAYHARIYKDGSGNTGSSHRVQTKYLSNGAYLRVKNITLGYTVPQNLLRKIFLNKVRVFITGENLFTFDHLPKGLDAEATDISAGGIYPFIKKYSFGVNVSF